MLPSLVLIGIVLLPSASAATVYVHVVPYIDSDAWSQNHVTALKEFLSWCEERNIKVAVFHYDVCEETAPGITDLIREYAGRGTISLVGLHSTSHALGGLPLSLQYWELEFNLRFLRNRVGINVVPVLSVPSWVFDTNTLYACDKLGVRVIICGADITVINPNHDPKWDRLDPIATHMLIGYFDVHGDRLYYVPALSYVSDLTQTAEDHGVTLRELLQNALRSLIDGGIVSTTGDAHLFLWVLVHPWELADTDIRQGFENFLLKVRSGYFNFEYRGVAVTFELSDPHEVINMILSAKTNPKPIPLPEPDYSSILHAMDYHHWWELVRLYPNKSELVWIWLDTMSRWRALDSALWDLTVNGAIDDSIRKDLYRAVKWVRNEALLEDALKYWDSNDARQVLLDERRALSVIYRKILTLHAELMGSMVRQDRVESLEREINRMKRELENISRREQDLERRLESLERELRGLKKQEPKRGLPALPVPLPWKRCNYFGRRRSRHSVGRELECHFSFLAPLFGRSGLSPSTLSRPTTARISG